MLTGQPAWPQAMCPVDGGGETRRGCWGQSRVPEVDTAERRTPETGTQMREGEQDVGDQNSVESESSAEWRERWGRRPQTSL